MPKTKPAMPPRPLATGTLLSILALALIVGVAPAEGRDRFKQYPPVQVSPDLAAEWILQLSPGSGVVPGYRRPHLGRATRNLDGVTYQGQAAVVVQPQPGYGYRPAVLLPGVFPGDRHGRAVVRGTEPRHAAIRQTRQVRRSEAPDPTFLPQTVDYPTREAAGTVIIDTEAKFLYMVEGGGRARRYGVGVGKPGFEWAGTHRVTQKKEWPTWTPPAAMRAREKSKGKILPARMDGGVANPLGARAMYLGSTLYRIHGTNQPWSIGKAVSSGCIRMRNEDVMELYERVPVGTRVVVL